MGKTTDNLIAMAKEVAPNPSGREFDHLLACGEQIAVSMVALALQARGVPAVSLTAGSAASTPTARSIARASATSKRAAWSPNCRPGRS